MSLNLTEDHQIRELQTQIFFLKAINAIQDKKIEDIEYWKAKIRSECGLVQGEEFSRVIGFFKNQRTEQDKENEKTIEAVKVCFNALKKYGPSVHVMKALAVALKLEAS